jgi:phosphate:Na+ symporter
MEFDISKYLVKITDQELDEQESTTVSVLFKTVNDIERISDHAVNLSEIASNIIDNKIEYSKTAQDELNVMFDACQEIIDITIESI